MAVPKSRLSEVNSSCETLEPRQLLASVLTGSTLYISGTEGNDVVGIAVRGPQLRVVTNGVLERFVLTSVNRIEIQAGAGNDIAGWAGISIPTYINCGAGNDSAVGGLGNDSLTGAAGKDTLRGGPGNDRVNGANTNDYIFGDDGDDVIYGGFGNDYAEGGAGKDRFFGEDGDDKLLGGLGNDGVYGGVGNDSLYGQEGGDYILGDDGIDLILGGAGDDNIDGGTGADNIYGEAGNDTINSKDNTAELVDGGDDDDTVTGDNTLDSITNVETVVGVVVPSAKYPRAISLNDESLWDEHWTDTKAKLKDLDVKAVRLWLNVDDWTERPHAYDTVNEADIVKTWQSGSQNIRTVIGGLAMKRAFELKRLGYVVMFTVQRYNGQPPANAAEVKDYFTALLTTTETTTTTKKFKDVVDYWEIGNEVDAPSMWAPSGINKTAGIQSYVDQYLLPAAEVLHSGTPSTWERVVSASVRFDPNDVNTILKQLKTENRLDAIDFVGYHPYGIYTPSPLVNEITNRVARTKAFADAVGKKMIATEWNVRGYAANGSQNTAWAAAIDYIYRTEILTSFEIGFYFNFTNNFAARGGSTSARPAGLVAHDTNMSVTTTSPVDTQIAYYQTPFKISDPFYATFKSWKAIPS